MTRSQQRLPQQRPGRLIAALELPGGWRLVPDSRTPPIPEATREGAPARPVAHGIYHRAMNGHVEAQAALYGAQLTTWRELVLDAMPLCSAWNRIYTLRPPLDHLPVPATNSAAGEQELVPARLWPLYAVCAGLAAVATIRAEPDDVLRMSQAIGTSPLVLSQHSRRIPGLQPVWDIGRRERLCDLWDIPSLIAGWAHAPLPPAVRREQCDALERAAEHHIEDYVRNSSMWHSASLSVAGLLYGDTPGHLAWRTRRHHQALAAAS
ncbi:hypothetical protein ACIBHX_46680 [Nonomuraea sp. NPDC050536]|uniref:hypothetical protein n=1 Tax=Nonomuraea sp. NPDC050536 TaxID=3364366 RepID=UPI0037CC9420